MEKQYLDLQGLEQFKTKVDEEIQEATKDKVSIVIDEANESLIVS